MLKEIFSLTKFSLMLLLGFLILVTTFTIEFNWPNSITYIDRFIYLNRFFSDFFLICAVMVLLCSLGKIGRSIAWLVASVFVVIYFIQSQSYATTGKYLPAVALENADHVDFLPLDNIVFEGLIWLFFALLFFKLASNYLIRVSWKAVLSVTFVLLLISTLIKNDKDWLSQQTQKARFDFYNTGQAGVKRVSPMSELLDTYGEYLEYLERQSFITDRPSDLSESTAEFIYDNLDFFGKQEPEYPLMRTTHLEVPAFLTAAKDGNTSSGSQVNRKPKNIIILFSEGFSARLMAPYSTSFPGLTPNIEAFSKSAIRVNNYYNHTYATYRGLGGQLCSIFPVGRLYKEVDYHCLGHALQEQGYRTRFMVSQTLAKTDLDQIFKQAGIQEVDGWESISDITSYDREGTTIVPDRVLFEGLVERLKIEAQKGAEDTPFMIGLYNFETHTGVNLTEQNDSYSGTESNPRESSYVLDTFHNFDRVFGTFWEYFQNSSHFDDTIVVLTTDHATYPSKDYVNLVKHEAGFTRLFIDQIPLLIYHPDVTESVTIDAKSATSLDFAPSMLNLLEFNKTKAPFLGESIFSINQKQLLTDMAGGSARIWFTTPERNYWGNISEGNFEKVRQNFPDKATRWEFIKYTESLERSNHLWKKEAPQ